MREEPVIYEDEYYRYDEAIDELVDDLLANEVQRDDYELRKQFLKEVLESIFDGLFGVEDSYHQSTGERQRLKEDIPLFECEKKIKKQDVKSIIKRSFKKFCSDALELYDICVSIEDDKNHDYIPPPEVIITEFWELFNIHELAWRDVFQVTKTRNNVDAKCVLLGDITLFPIPKFSQLVAHGNGKNGYYAETQFEWEAIDAFINEVIPVAKQSARLSYAISAFRIGTEFWKYHVDNMNSLSGANNFYKIGKDLKLAQKHSYSIHAIQHARNLGTIKKFWSYMVLSLVVGSLFFIFGYSGDSVLLIIGGSLFTAVPVLLILWGLFFGLVKVVWKFLFGSNWNYKVLEKVTPRTEEIRMELYGISNSFERADVDIEGAVQDIRKARRKDIALPAVLITVLKNQIDKGVHHF